MRPVSPARQLRVLRSLSAESLPGCLLLMRLRQLLMRREAAAKEATGPAF
jgi:hypothetical protein